MNLSFESKAICAMQPYFLPYLGYFALVKKVDTFVVLDSVQFIRRGWMNRNRIPANDGVSPWQYMTVPIQSAPQVTPISQIRLDSSGPWREKLKKSLTQLYSKAPFFERVMPLLDPLWSGEVSSLRDLNEELLKLFSDYLGLGPKIWVRSSEICSNHPELTDLRAQDLILGICRVVGAKTYWNLPGGQELYNAEIFERNGMELCFVPSLDVEVLSQRFPLVSSWSILDLAMKNSSDDIHSMIDGLWAANITNPIGNIESCS